MATARTVSESMSRKLASEQSDSPLRRPVDITKWFQAKVVDVEDEYKIGRVKVWIPDLMKESVPENDGLWASPGMTIFSGNDDTKEIGGDDCGSLMPPPKESYVWVYFEDEDFTYPRYVSGVPKDENESVPVENQYGAEWWKKWTLIKTPKGKQILLSDDKEDSGVIIRGSYPSRGKRDFNGDPRLPDDAQYFQMMDKSGEIYSLMKGMGKICNYIKIDDKEDFIRIQHKNGSHIEFNKQGDIIINSKRKILENCAPAIFKPPYKAVKKGSAPKRSSPG